MNWFKRKIIEQVFRRYGVKWFENVFKGKLGWKTIGAALSVPIIVILDQLGILDPSQVQLALACAVSLFGVGVRHAIAKIKK